MAYRSDGAAMIMAAIKNHERSQWRLIDCISGIDTAQFGRHFHVLSLTGDVHAATGLTQLRGKWTAVLADTGEPAFITHIRKAPMSLREIEEMGK